MSFQFVIDNAQRITMNTRKIVASTQARDGTVRAVSRGGQVWQFEVTLPNGPRYTDYRRDIAKLEALDRVNTDTFSFNNTGHSWMVAYQGDVANPDAITAEWTTGNTIILTGGQATSGFNFRAGDLIQLGSGGAYRVAADVAWDSNTVTLHRPLIDAAGNATLRVAEDVEFTVICTQFPDHTLFERDQISWSGPFVFVEDLT